MKAIARFKDYRLFEIFMLALIGGMPFSILYTSLIVWLTEEGVDIAIITTFAIARISYSLKVLWAPVVDYFPVPLLKRAGHRKSWLIFCVMNISLLLLCMSMLTPKISLGMIYFLSISIGFFGATFDINYDALRIEKLSQEEQALGAANAVLGYRIGMLIISSGSLYITHVTGNWQLTFRVMSGIFALAIIFILTIKENKIERDEIETFSLWKKLEIMILHPLKDFFTRDYSVIILLAIIFYKVGDAMLAIVALPFYLELGFAKSQIATVVKLFGILATILGSYAGGFLVYKIGNFKGLLFGAIAQSITNLVFVWLNHQGPDLTALIITNSIENFSGGIGTAALVGYLSNLCNKKYSATQFALLSSAASLCNNTIVMYAGNLVKNIGWDYFFILTVIFSLPGIILLIYLNQRIKTT